MCNFETIPIFLSHSETSLSEFKKLTHSKENTDNSSKNKYYTNNRGLEKTVHK